MRQRAAPIQYNGQTAIPGCKAQFRPDADESGQLLPPALCPALSLNWFQIRHRQAKGSADAKVLAGGECDDSKGYFIRPTLVQARKADFKLMQEEIFGPVLTVYVYPDGEYEKTLDLCDRTSPYALTGAIFAQDRGAMHLAMEKLRHAAGNFYINGKPTGAVVNQQPFGGGRASGTNDKAGSALNLARWVSARTIKETFIPITDYRYPFMGEE